MNDLMEAEYRRLQQQQSVPAAASPPPTPSLQQKQHSHSQQFEASKSEKPSLKRPAPDSSAAHYEAEKLKRQAAMQMPFAIQQQYFSLQHQQHFIAANGAVVPVRGYNYRPLFGGSPSSVPPTMERTNSQQNPANIAEQTAGYSQVKKMSIQNLLG
jgi:hypothetical protein